MSDIEHVTVTNSKKGVDLIAAKYSTKDISSFEKLIDSLATHLNLRNDELLKRNKGFVFFFFVITDKEIIDAMISRCVDFPEVMSQSYREHNFSIKSSVYSDHWTVTFVP